MSRGQRLNGRGYYVVNYGARGHGESDWAPNGDYSIPTLAADLTSVRAAIRGPVALVSASTGGMTSFFAVGTSDRRFSDALVMVDIVLRPAEAGVEKIRSFMTAHQGGFANLAEAVAAAAAYNPERPQPKDASGL